MKERLKIIADSVNRGESMADIGTDHGFLPIFLLNEGICERAIATDISEAAIAKTVADQRQVLEEIAEEIHG